MKAFQYYFNTKRQKEAIFESFSFKPDNAEHSNLGSLYIIGKISNALPQSQDTLKALAEVIRKSYYTVLNKDANSATKNALAKANEFLEENVKQGNVNWMGNLDFALLSVNGMFLNFVTVGDAKIILSRGEELYDIGENLEYQDAECGVGSVFPNVAIGKLSPDDRLIVATDEIYEFLDDNDLIEEIVGMKVWSEKEFSKLFKPYNQEIKEYSGIVSFIDISMNGESSVAPSFSMPSFSMPKIEIGNNGLLQKLLVIFLTVGIIFFGGIQIKKIFFTNTNQNVVNTDETVETAGPEEISYEEQEVPSLTASKPAFHTLESISPTGIVQSGNYLLFYTRGQKNIYALNLKTKELKKISTENEIVFGDGNPDMTMFLSADNEILKYDPNSKELSFVQKADLPEGANVTGFTFYQSKLYLLDGNSGRILRATGGETGDWLKSETKRAKGGVSMDIDGDVWVLNSNSLDKYSGNVYKETIQIGAETPVTNATKLWASYSNNYLYILEPQQKRLIVTDKTGKVVKTFQNNQWNNLRDFFVTPDREIYLLNGQDIIDLYQTL